MPSPCSVDGCSAPTVGQTLCRKHYGRMRSKGTTSDVRKNAASGRKCERESCVRLARSRGLCGAHRKSVVRPDVLAAKRLAWRCEDCGGLLPDERTIKARFCSVRCKDGRAARDGRNSRAVLKRYYKRKYGLTREDIDQMLADQGGGCAICRNTRPRGKNGGFHVDHCHATGVVRGILCHSCNVSIGHFRDDPGLLRDAAAYLERF